MMLWITVYQFNQFNQFKQFKQFNQFNQFKQFNLQQLISNNFQPQFFLNILKAVSVYVCYSWIYFLESIFKIFSIIVRIKFWLDA